MLAMMNIEPAMLKPLLTQMAVHLRDSAFEAQHLSLIVWALAVLECKPVVLLEQIEQNTIRQLRDFNQQNCANILWGFAKLNYQPRALLPVMTARLLEDGEFLAAMKPVEVSDTAFALALLGTPREHARLMGALAELVVPDSLLPRFSSRQLVTLTWSFARLEVRPAQLDAWLQRLVDAHARQPLLAPDQRNIKVTLTLTLALTLALTLTPTLTRILTRIAPRTSSRWRSSTSSSALSGSSPPPNQRSPIRRSRSRRERGSREL